MPTQLIEIDPNLVAIEQAGSPDRDPGYIFEHLQHYCSLFDPLPAIGIRVGKDAITATRGVNYLRIAQNLGRPSIRAAIQAPSDPDAVAELMDRPGVRALNWAEIDAQERANPEIEQWHVYYFERPLGSEEKSRFETDVIGVLRDLYAPGSGRSVQDPVRSVDYDDDAKRAQFLILVPIADESWFGAYRAAARKFSDDVVKIVSFQGRRFT